MDIGINTACLQKKSNINALELLDFAVANNFKGIEFRDEYPFFEDINTNDKKRIYTRIEKESLLCSVHLSFYDLNVGSFRKKLRDIAVTQHQDAVKKAANLGAKFVTMHGGHMSQSFYNAESMSDVEKYSADSISLIRETCQDMDIILCIENMSLFDSKVQKSFTQPEHLIDLYHHQNEKIKFTFDFGHAVSIEREPESFIKKLGADKISFGHLSDNNFLKDQHLAVGAGSINYVSFIKTYIEQEWDFPLLIETGTAEQALESKRYLTDLYKKVISG